MQSNFFDIVKLLQSRFFLYILCSQFQIVKTHLHTEIIQYVSYTKYKICFFMVALIVAFIDKRYNLLSSKHLRWSLYQSEVGNLIKLRNFLVQKCRNEMQLHVVFGLTFLIITNDPQFLTLCGLINVSFENTKMRHACDI